MSRLVIASRAKITTETLAHRDTALVAPAGELLDRIPREI